MVPIISTIAGSETYPLVENIVAQSDRRSIRTLNGNSAKSSSINPSTNGVGDVVVVVVAIVVVDRLVGVGEGVWVVGCGERGECVMMNVMCSHNKDVLNSSGSENV
jgi:hypothetical protein